MTSIHGYLHIFIVFLQTFTCTGQNSGIENQDVIFRHQYDPSDGILDTVTWRNRGVDGSDTSNRILTHDVATDTVTYGSNYNGAKAESLIDIGTTTVTLVIHSAANSDITTYEVSTSQGLNANEEQFNLTSLIPASETALMQVSMCGTEYPWNGVHVVTLCGDMTIRVLMPNDYTDTFRVNFFLDGTQAHTDTTTCMTAQCQYEYTGLNSRISSSNNVTVEIDLLVDSYPLSFEFTFIDPTTTTETTSTTELTTTTTDPTTTTTNPTTTTTDPTTTTTDPTTTTTDPTTTTTDPTTTTTVPTTTTTTTDPTTTTTTTDPTTTTTEPTTTTTVPTTTTTTTDPTTTTTTTDPTTTTTNPTTTTRELTTSTTELMNAFSGTSGATSSDGNTELSSTELTSTESISTVSSTQVQSSTSDSSLATSVAASSSTNSEISTTTGQTTMNPSSSTADTTPSTNPRSDTTTSTATTRQTTTMARVTTTVLNTPATTRQRPGTTTGTNLDTTVGELTTTSAPGNSTDIPIPGPVVGAIVTISVLPPTALSVVLNLYLIRRLDT